MHSAAVVGRSLRLLSPRERRKLYLAAGFQIALGLLDLVGILLVGLVGASAVSTLQSGELPSILQRSFALVGWQPRSTVEAILLIAAAAALLLIGKSAAATIGMRRVVTFLATRQAFLAADLSRRLFAQSLTVVKSRSSHETAYGLMQGANALSLYVLAQGIMVLAEVSSLVMTVIALVIVSPLIALIAIIAFSLLAGAIHMVIGSKAGQAGHRLARADVDSLEAIQEALSSFREVSVWRKGEFFAGRIFVARLDSARASADLLFLSLVPKYILEGGLVLVGSLLAFFLFATQSAEVAAASLAVFIAAAMRIIPAVLRLQGSVLTMRNTSGAVERTLLLADDLDFRPVAMPVDLEPSAVADRTADMKSATCSPPEIIVRNVTFTYPGRKSAAVADANLCVLPGMSLALVGPSGAGKSTIADLIMGLLAPDSGDIVVGAATRSTEVTYGTTQIAYVPQHVTLMRASVLENVAFGVDPSGADPALVVECLSRVGLQPEDFGPDGLQARIGEGGHQASGGQRQRLGIARALYSHPDLLVLDEATSALDAATENIVTRTLERLHGSVTVVVIAHRLSTVRSCDQIAYVHAGKILAQGSFDAVRKSISDFDRQARLLGL